MEFILKIKNTIRNSKLEHSFPTVIEVDGRSDLEVT